MTLTLELPPAMERGLEHAAHRHGMALEKYAFDVLAREAEEFTSQSWDNWLRAISELHQHIQAEVVAGTMNTVTADDVTRVIHETREERTVEILAAAGIIVEPQPYMNGDQA